MQWPSIEPQPTGELRLPVNSKSIAQGPQPQAVLRGAAGPIAGLYIHVPFCFHKCHYCDFYSIADPAEADGAADRQRRFVDRLTGELAHRAAAATLAPTTVFVGGGTPTLLAADQWQRLLNAINRLKLLEHVGEFTVEANPETVTAELARILARGGVNRVSIGAQSFNPALLKTLERWHEPANVARAVDTFTSAGIENINLDLIFAIPGQTMQSLDEDLDAALALGPTHLSCYALIFEPNTALAQRRRLGQIQPIDPDLERAMYQRVLDRLEAEGFEHYEVSNWARGGQRCRHNMLYWTNANWLGVGPSAASHVDGHRWKNEAHLGRYLAGDPDPPTTDHERLGADESLGEQIMLRLRLLEGAPRAWLASHMSDDDARWATIEELIAMGMLKRTDTHVRLTRRGLFVADSVIAKLL